jgi:hypothetical protein
MRSTIRRATLRMLFVAGIATAAVGVSGPAIAGDHRTGTSPFPGNGVVCGYVYGLNDGTKCIDLGVEVQRVCGYVYGLNDGTKCIYITVSRSPVGYGASPIGY